MCQQKKKSKVYHLTYYTFYPFSKKKKRKKTNILTGIVIDLKYVNVIQVVKKKIYIPFTIFSLSVSVCKPSIITFSCTDDSLVYMHYKYNLLLVTISYSSLFHLYFFFKSYYFSSYLFHISFFFLLLVYQLNYYKLFSTWLIYSGSTVYEFIIQKIIIFLLVHVCRSL